MTNTKEYYNQKNDYGVSSSRAKRILALLKDEKGKKKVFDLGCGAGGLGKFLIEKGFQVDGCDISQNAVSKASKVLGRAFECNIEEKIFNFSLQGYDYMIASEVIEHLFSPEEFLQKVKESIDPKTELIITTPNFLVWTNRIKMLFGKFEYEESGFFDRGHIHFFSYKSLLKMCDQLGFEVIEENHVFHHRVPISLAQLNPNLFAFQLVIKIKVKESI